MKKTLRATGLALGLVAITACSSQSDKAQLTGDMDLSGLAADQSVSPENKAETYAKAGEQLAQTSAFPLADAVLDLALYNDPTNKRAQFYKAFLAQKMALRGALIRVKPLVRQNPEGVAQYNRAVSELPKGALRDFLMDGKEDIKTEKDAQAFLDGIHEGREQLRNFLKTNKDLELTLRLNDVLSAGASKQNCTYSVSGEYAYNYSCSTVVITELKMNRADIESMQQMVAGAQVYSTLLNAYDVTGAIATAKKLQNSSSSNAAVLAELGKYKDFAKLRSKQAVTKIAEMGMDAIAGVRWASELQKELCPRGESVPNQRPGFVISDGICIRENSGDQSVEQVLQTIELALSGQTMVAEINGLQTEVNYAAPILNPIKDIKALQIKLDECGRVVGSSDPTAGGVLPKGDAAEILAAARPRPSCQN